MFKTGEEYGIEKQCSPLPVTVYVVVPRLPKDAQIEWQVTARNDLGDLSGEFRYKSVPLV